MSPEQLQDLLVGLGVLSALLLVGAILRAKVKFLQRLLLPASVIGGFVGLLLGPSVLGRLALFAFPKSEAAALLQFPESWVTTWEGLPGVLIVPIFAAVPLGMFMGKRQGNRRKTGAKAVTIFGLFTAVAALQSVIGFGTNLGYSAVTGDELYRTFGYELAAGFSGGHGTASATGTLLRGYGLDYYQTAQGVALTCATVGMLAGMLIGIYLINRANRRGETALGKMGELPAEITKGYQPDVEKQEIMGHETTTSSSIETLTTHLALLLVACLGGYGLKAVFDWLAASSNQVISLVGTAFGLVPVWFYAMLAMYLVNYVLIKLKLNWLVDAKVKARVTGLLTDFAVVAAIASLNLSAVAAYIVPITIMCALGILVTYLVVFPLHRRAFGSDDYGFERGIITWGVNTGVMITGMMLLKIVDPDYETPVLSDFSLGFSMYSLANIVLGLVSYGLLAGGTTVQNFLWYLFCVVLFLGIGFIGMRMMRSGGERAEA